MRITDIVETLPTHIAADGIVIAFYDPELAGDFVGHGDGHAGFLGEENEE